MIRMNWTKAIKKAAKQIVQKGGRRFNYYRPTISTKDVGDMSIEELNLELNPQLSDMETIRI